MSNINITVYNLKTKQFVTLIDSESFTIERKYNSADSCTVNTITDNLTFLNSIGLFGIYIQYNKRTLFTGIIWDYELDIRTHQLKLLCKSIESYIDYLYLTHSILVDTLRVDSLIKEIYKQLHSQSDIPIFLMRNVPTIKSNSRYLYSVIDSDSILKLINTLSENPDTGFDYEFIPNITDGYVEYVLNIVYPKFSRVAEKPLEQTKNLEFSNIKILHSKMYTDILHVSKINSHNVMVQRETPIKALIPKMVLKEKVDNIKSDDLIIKHCENESRKYTQPVITVDVKDTVDIIEFQKEYLTIDEIEFLEEYVIGATYTFRFQLLDEKVNRSGVLTSLGLDYNKGLLKLKLIFSDE